MKQLSSLALLIAAALPAAAQYQDVKERQSQADVPFAKLASVRDSLFNFDWKFRLGSKGDSPAAMASPGLDDSQWRRLDLPHDFQFEQPWTEKGSKARGFKPMCEGWYRKSFEADSAWMGRKVVLDFGAIVYLGDVYINGHKVASTDYGYVGLEADLTPHLRFDTTNVVAVYASTGPQRGSRWYTGGGLFRDVRLQVSNPTRIARHGLYVTTPTVAADSAMVAVQLEIEGWRNKGNIGVRATVTDPEGRIVGWAEAPAPEISKRPVVEIELPEIKVKNPRLWDLDSPELYTVEAELMVDGVTVDRQSDQFGIRTIEYSPDFGFKLNGRKVFLQGNANHNDLGLLGAAAYDDAIDRMMRQLKAFGYNTIRCSHNPYSDSFARIADRVGLLIVDELSDKWSDKDYWGGRQAFTAIWPGLINEWVKRDRNRPSVILWSLGNELQVREDWAGFPGMNDTGITTYRVMDQVVKRWDKTRPTTVAMFPARAGNITRKDQHFNDYLVPPELACATEVASFNYQADKYKAYKDHAPHLIIFQSEAETSGLLQPYYNMDRDRSVGMAYWGSAEYWGESNGWPKKGWNYSFFDHNMYPHPQAWLVKSAFVPDSTEVRIGVADRDASETVDWNDVQVGQVVTRERWDYPEGSSQAVFAYSNAPQIELVYNGRSLGIQRNDTADYARRNMAYWPAVDYGRGGTLTAIARDDSGRELARHSISTPGPAKRLDIRPENPDDFHANGMDLLYITVDAVDAKGRRVWSCDEPLTVEVSGAATLLAIDNGDHYTDLLFPAGRDTKPMLRGRMTVVLRAGRTPGEATVKFTSPKFKNKTTKLTVKP